MHYLSKHHLLTGSLLVAGMSIGVGMLALPVVTAPAGLLPALAIYCICWFIMVCYGRLILEACIWMPKESNMISLSKLLLGPKAAVVCWILYLFLFYCLMIAHIAAGGEATRSFSGLPFPLATLIYTVIFIPAVYLGTKSVSRLNVILMSGVVITWLFFFTGSFPEVHMSLLKRSDWLAIWPSIPVILTAFGFQNLVPTLYNFMDRDHKAIRKALWIGTLTTLILYCIWELLVLGIVPFDVLSGALQEGKSAIGPLETVMGSEWIGKVSQAFAVFAMSTSFVGISIAFIDFWADGLKWSKRGKKRTFLLLLVFAIPFIFVLINPSIFLTALRYAGGIGMIILFGVFPILFVWSGRYVHGYCRHYEFVKGGKISLILLLLFTFLVLFNMLY